MGSSVCIIVWGSRWGVTERGFASPCVSCDMFAAKLSGRDLFLKTRVKSLILMM